MNKSHRLLDYGPWKEPLKERRQTRRNETKQKQDTRQTKATTGRPGQATEHDDTKQNETRRNEGSSTHSKAAGIVPFSLGTSGNCKSWLTS